jgi:nitrate/nitrite-specific signal transduction histidine kinase
VKIKTKLGISVVLAVGMVFVVAVTLSWTEWQFNEALQDRRAINEVVKAVVELNILTNDYLLHQEERPKRQWQLRHASAGRALGGMKAHGAQEEFLLERLRKHHQNLSAFFNQLVENLEGGAVGGGQMQIAGQLQERLVGQLDASSRSMVSDVYQLEEIGERNVRRTEKRAYVLIMVLSFAIAAVIAANSILLGKSIVGPINRLQRGTEVIAAGDLAHKVGTSATDEVGQLSRAFDRMTEELKNITVSREELKKEVAERTRAEEQLKASNEELQRMNKLMIGRELRMVELKKEIGTLKEKTAG